MIKVVIIEDEQHAAKRIEKMLLDISGSFEVIGRCDSVESSVAFLSGDIRPDLILLDIQLGDGLSFEIFSKVDVNCPVIFTTAYDEYAIKAFELNSIDYLLKPVSPDKLKKAIDKFNKFKQPTTANDLKLLVSLLDKPKPEYKQRFLVSVGERLVSVPTAGIACFYSVEKSTFMVTAEGKSYSVEFSLDKLESMLSPDDFFRVNRQYLVALTAIKKIQTLSKSRLKLHLEPPSSEDLLVSAARTAEFRQWLDR